MLSLRNRMLRIAFIASAIAVLGGVGMPCSRADADEKGMPRLFLRVELARSESNVRVYDSYFAGSREDTLRTFITRSLKQALEAKLEELNYQIIIEEGMAEAREKADPLQIIHDIRCKITVDQHASIVVHVYFTDVTSGKEAEIFKTGLKYDLLERKDWWSNLKNMDLEATEVDRSLHAVAVSVVSLISDDIAQWIVESNLRIRVELGDFKQIGGNRDLAFLEDGLASMVESDLSKSEAIVVFDKTAAGKGRGNYLVDGTFLEIGDQVRIDLRCVKRHSARVLASRRVIVEAIDLTTLSRGVTEACHYIKRAMEADFRRSTRTIAIAARPPSRLFAFEKPSDINIDVTREIAQAMTLKLKAMAVKSTEDGCRLDMQVIDTSEEVMKYLREPADPAEILADLDIDYLVMIEYTEVGSDFRLTANLYSYDLRRPAIEIFVGQTSARKARINEAVDTIVTSLCRELCKLGFVDPQIECGTLGEDRHAKGMLRRMNTVVLPELRQLKGFGIRLGAVAKRNSPDLFLGKESTIYVEPFFSFGIPIAHFDYFGIDAGIEPSAGFALPDAEGWKHGFEGVTGAHAFLNVKVLFSFWGFSRLPLLASLGGGIGNQGIWYKLIPGRKKYLGEKTYRNSLAVFAGTIFGEAEFPLWGSYRFLAMYRWVSQSDEITSFEHVPVEGIERPVGRLGGSYLAVGLKYTWR